MNLDDLSASTNAIMELLSKLLTSSSPFSSSAPSESDFSLLVPRLYPFLCHSISSVRKSCLLTLKTILLYRDTGSVVDGSSSNDARVCTWISPILQVLLCHLFQRLSLEENEEILQLVQEVSEIETLYCYNICISTCTCNLFQMAATVARNCIFLLAKRNTYTLKLQILSGTYFSIF